MGIIITTRMRLFVWEPGATPERKIETIPLANNISNGYIFHDGRTLWIGALAGANTITPRHLETNTNGTSINIGHAPLGLWYDGRLLWSIVAAGTLRQIDLTTATIVNTITLPVGTYVGLTGDKRTIWTINTTSGNIEQYDPETGTLLGGFTHPANPKDLHYDGRFLYVLTGDISTTGTIKTFDPSTGTQTHSADTTVYTVTDFADGLCGDGRFLYAVENVL